MSSWSVWHSKSDRNPLNCSGGETCGQTKRRALPHYYAFILLVQNAYSAFHLLYFTEMLVFWQHTLKYIGLYAWISFKAVSELVWGEELSRCEQETKPSNLDNVMHKCRFCSLSSLHKLSQFMRITGHVSRIESTELSRLKWGCLVGRM